MAYGFRPVKTKAPGGVKTNVFMDYQIADDYGTAIYNGDPVKLVAGGYIERAAAGDTSVGVFMGCEYTPDSGVNNGKPVFDEVWPASQSATQTSIKAFVWDDPDTVFMIESDQDTTALAFADVGQNIDFLAGTGSATTKKSGFKIDSNDASKGTGTANVRVLGSAETDKTFTAAGTVMDIYVRFVEHFWSSTTGI